MIRVLRRNMDGGSHSSQANLRRSSTARPLTLPPYAAWDASDRVELSNAALLPFSPLGWALEESIASYAKNFRLAPMADGSAGVSWLELFSITK